MDKAFRQTMHVWHPFLFLSYLSCCQSDRQTFELPVKCFEQNGCFGLHWLGDDACSEKYQQSIASKIEQVKKDLQNGDDPKLDIEIRSGLNDIVGESIEQGDEQHPDKKSDGPR